MEPLFHPSPSWMGLQGAALCFPSFSCIFQIIGFSYHIVKLSCHLSEPFVNRRMPLAKLEMQAQTSAHPATMRVPICENRRRTDRSTLESLEARFEAFVLRKSACGPWSPFPYPPQKLGLQGSPPLCDIPSGCCFWGPGHSPVLPFACCVGSLLSVGRCGRCSCWCRFRVPRAQWLVCRGCAPPHPK